MGVLEALETPGTGWCAETRTLEGTSLRDRERDSAWTRSEATGAFREPCCQLLCKRVKIQKEKYRLGLAAGEGQ